MSAAPAAILALQRSAGNARVAAMLGQRRMLARHNASDHRLPANQPEALAHAVSAGVAVAGALASLAGAADPRRRNVPAYVAQEGLAILPLTPRHDSTVAGAAAPHPPINFFAGAGYGVAVLLPDTATRSIDATRTQLSIRARGHADVDTVLAQAAIAELIVEAVTEVAQTRAARSGVGGLTSFDLYKARFNALYTAPAFAGLSDGYKATLSSRGPKTERSRHVFEAIHAEDAAFEAAYDGNVGGLKEQVDRYQGPEGLNLLNSPGLQRLRHIFLGFPTPVPMLIYPLFKAQVTGVAQTLSPGERAEVDRSDDWQTLLVNQLSTQAQRNEIGDVIRTATAPPPPPGPAPAPAAPGGAVNPQTFIDSVTLSGPAAAVPAQDRTQPVTLTPHSALANPGVAISAQTTVTPAASVSGPNVSPPAAWTNGANSAAPFTPAIAVTGPVALDAQLALVNGPAGLVRTHPIPPVHFAINDQRQANLAAHWQPELQFNDGARQSAFVVGTSHPRYVGASQTINVQGSMPAAPQHNPGLTLSIESRVERGGVVIAPARVAAWLPNAPESAVVTLVIAAPGAMPAAGDPISVVTRLLDATGAQVNVRATAMVVGQEATYLQPAAEARWNADEAHLHSAAAGGFVHFLAGAGGAAAGLANLIDRPGHPGPIIIHPMVQRHDSSAYVAAENAGVPDPSKAAYVIKTPPYLPHPDPAHTIVLPVGAGGWRIPANPAYPGAFILLSRTPDVTLGLPRRPDDELQIYAVHESTHLMDRPGAGPFEDYKTEFRAYWNDGRFGPPNQAVPASPDEFAAEFDPTTPTPGPKSRRANRIFHEMYDDPVLYSFCQPNYDGNVGGFRDQVDSYLVPDGVNLILSAHLEDLRTRFAVGVPAGFPAFRTMVQGFFGPPAPTLSAGERAYVKRSRAWRDLVDNLAGATAPEKATLKADMGIP